MRLASALRATFVVLAMSVATTSPAAAASFDFIYADRIEVTTYPIQSGFTPTSNGNGLVVNKGAVDIGAAELFNTTFQVVSSNPAVHFSPFINDPGPSGNVAPVLPNEAVGSVVPGGNEVLTTLLLPGETLRNTRPLQVISFTMTFPAGFAGAVDFDVTMTMGTDIATFTVVANITAGSEFLFSYPSASRVSSVPLATPARASSWGAIKKLYR